MDHASLSSTATSSGSEVRGGARGTVILSDLRTEGVVFVVPGTGGRRRGKVGSSWGFGPDTRGIAGKGLLILLRGPLKDTWDGGSGKSNSAGGRGRGPEGMHASGEASETTCPSSRAYHDISSSSVRSTSGSASANSSAVAELALGSAVLLIMSGWICTRCAAGGLPSRFGLGLRLRPGHSSSSDVSGVIGMSLLEQADMLVREGVGERVRARGAVFGR